MGGELSGNNYLFNHAHRIQETAVQHELYRSLAVIAYNARTLVSVQIWLALARTGAFFNLANSLLPRQPAQI